MKALVIAVIVCACFLAATGHLRGSLKDYMNRGPTFVEVQAPKSVAVEFQGGEVKEAENLATACGVVNRGKVGNLAEVFNFEVDEGSNMDTVVECLRRQPTVVRVEPQTLRKMVPKENN